MRVFCYIPVRAHSSRLPRKWAAEVGGVSLLRRAIDAALDGLSPHNHVKRVVVGTDSEEVARAALSVDTDFNGPGTGLIAVNLTPPIPDRSDLRAELRAWWATLDEKPDALVLLNPTSPLRTATHVREALALLESTGGDSVVSVTRGYEPFFGGRFTTGGWWWTNRDPDMARPRTQDLDNLAYENGAIFAATRSYFEAHGDFTGGRCYAYPMEREVSIDVDTPADLRMAQALCSSSTCVLCHASLHGAVVVNEMARHDTPQRSVRCSSCDLVQADPKPEPHALRHYYESGEYRRLFPVAQSNAKPGEPGYQATLDPAFIAERARMLVERHSIGAGDDVLDVGCGDGSTMAAVRALVDDVDVRGLDADPLMLTKAWEVNRIDSPDSGSRHRIVTAHHVLEHHLDPVAFVRDLAGHAWSHGGVVHGEVPDVEDVRDPATFWQYPHVTYFSATTLRRTLEAGGLRDVQTAKLGAFLVGWGRT